MTPRRSLAAVVVFALAAAGGCRSYDGPAESSSGRATGFTTTTAPPVTASTTAAPAGAVTAPATTTTAAPDPGLSQAGGPTTVPDGGAGTGFARPGTYRYSSTGRSSSTLGGSQSRDGEVTLRVDPPAGADQHSVRQGPGRTTEQVLRQKDGSVYVVSLRLAEQGLTKEVRPSPPGVALPADAAPGRSWSWRAVSTDGQTVVHSEFRAVRTEDVTVGAARVPALVLEVVVTLTGDVTAMSTQTMWVSARHGLVLRLEDTTQGRLGAITFTTTSTDTLASLDPA